MKHQKNALSEVYYKLTLQVLSDEYTNYIAKIDAISYLTNAINLELQKAIRSNKLKREEDKESLKKETNSIFAFKKKKSNLKWNCPNHHKQQKISYAKKWEPRT